jgi:hypothetical protein
MKHIIVSVIAIAGIGATAFVSSDASATLCAWEYSPGYFPTTLNGFTTTEGNFSADIGVGYPAQGATSANTTGAVRVGPASCTGPSGEFFAPTCHQAFAVCWNDTYRVGPVKCETTVGGTSTESFTPLCGSGTTLAYGYVGVYEY